MAVIEGGTSAALANVESNTKALLVSNRPMDVGALGAYCLSASTGTMAASLAAGSQVFSFRWTDATRVCVITRIVCDGAANAGTAFAAGVAKFESVIARSYTADSATGTLITLGGNNQKLRTSMGTTLVTSGASARIAATAAITAGTQTLDANPFGQVMGGVVATAGTQFISGDATFYDAGSTNMYPVVLAQNEGFIIRATVPATGTWSAGFSVRWYELAAY